MFTQNKLVSLNILKLYKLHNMLLLMRTPSFTGSLLQNAVSESLNVKQPMIAHNQTMILPLLYLKSGNFTCDHINVLHPTASIIGNSTGTWVHILACDTMQVTITPQWEVCIIWHRRISRVLKSNYSFKETCTFPLWILFNC